MGEGHGDVERTSRSYDTVAEQYALQIAHELAGKPVDRALYGLFAELVGTAGTVAELVDAMKASDKEKILAESDVLAGLIVDLRSPLNLTDNFDGQRTGQHGPHPISGPMRAGSAGP